MEVLIVGAGAIGRWFGTIVKNPVYADIDPAHAAEAATTTGRSVSIDAEITIDVVCIAVPMTDADQAIERHASKATSAIIDLTGAMKGPLTAMQTHAPAIERASFHPLFAPDNAPGRIAVAIDAAGPTVASIRDALADHGNTLFDVTPIEHDRAMETIQAKTHAAVLAFALAAEDVPPDYGTPVYDGLLELVDDVTNGTPRVYADIQATFGGATDVAAAAERIATADPDTFERLYREASDDP